jgi:tRNA-Thr(GGU) m(6)t(6)A37 methyltransferase TsaA
LSPAAPTTTLTLTPIGVLHSAHATKVAAARQPVAAADSAGIIDLFPGRNFEHALEDIATWERLWVIFWFHHNRGWRPKVMPPRNTTGRKGVFATRAPHRPNPLGLSVVRLERVAGLQLFIRDVDMLDGTPVLDIKPYVPYADAFPDARHGWLESPRDPVAAHTVCFTTRADQQLEWIAGRSLLPLRERISSILSLGPTPHPYRRIRRVKDDLMQLAVQDWRVRFTVTGTQVLVLEVLSGYRPSQLNQAALETDSATALHREFVFEQACVLNL